MKEQIMGVLDYFGDKYSISEDERYVYFTIDDYIVTSYMLGELCKLDVVFFVDATLSTKDSVTIAFCK